MPLTHEDLIVSHRHLVSQAPRPRFANSIAIGLLAAVTTFGGSVGCSESGGGGTADGGATGADCTRDEDCGAEEVCSNGQCVSACTEGICLGDVPTPVDDLPDSEGGLEEIEDDDIDKIREASCRGIGGEPEAVPAVLMFVVDLSTSMKQPAPGSALTKWQETQPILAEAIDSLPANAAVGVLLYPNMATTPNASSRDSDQCVNVDALVSLELLDDSGSAQRDRITALLLDTPVPDNSGTPTHDAYSVALEHMRNTRLVGRKYIILLTDGQPTYSLQCVGDGLPEHAVDEQPIIDEISSALGDDIATFVIGAPGSEQTVKVGEDARPWLSQAAEEGGTAPSDCSHEGPDYCHFDMVQQADFGEGLRRTLEVIADQIVSCEYDLPAPPEDQQLDRSDVTIVLTTSDGVKHMIQRDSDPDCEEGWHYSEDLNHISLCPTTCRQVKRDAEASMELLFGCIDTDDPVVE